jgi:hypothetical protein
VVLSTPGGLALSRAASILTPTCPGAMRSPSRRFAARIDRSLVRGAEAGCAGRRGYSPALVGSLSGPSPVRDARRRAARLRDCRAGDCAGPRCVWSARLLGCCERPAGKPARPLPRTGRPGTRTMRAGRERRALMPIEEHELTRTGGADEAARSRSGTAADGAAQLQVCGTEAPSDRCRLRLSWAMGRNTKKDLTLALRAAECSHHAQRTERRGQAADERPSRAEAAARRTGYSPRAIPCGARGGRFLSAWPSALSRERSHKVSRQLSPNS